MIQVTLTFAGAAEAATALARMAGVISPLDRPDAGVFGGDSARPPVTATPQVVSSGPAAPPATDPAAVFGGEPVRPPVTAAAVPTPAAVAPSTVVAATLPTAPAGPTIGIVEPPVGYTLPAPPPAHVATAPTAPAAPQTVANGGATHDASGLPYDGRIHSSTRAFTADGMWRKRRGVDDVTMGEVERQLRAATVYVPPAPVAAAAALVPMPPGVVTVAADVPVPPAPPVAPVAPLGFGDLAVKFGDAMVSRALTQQHIAAACRAAGLETFNQLIHAPAGIPIVDAELSRVLCVAPGRPA